MTNEEKQIEEIKQLARDIFEPREAIDGIDLAFAAVHGADRDDTHFMRIATHLYGKSYRKASDVAREIFAEIEKVFRLHTEGGYYLNGVWFHERLDIDTVDAIAELKKKYESEENKE